MNVLHSLFIYPDLGLSHPVVTPSTLLIKLISQEHRPDRASPHQPPLLCSSQAPGLLINDSVILPQQTLQLWLLQPKMHLSTL